MSQQIEFFFDFGSPTSYLAYTQLPKLAAETGATLLWRPMLLGGVFKATGNASPVTVPAKGRWMFQDMARWARRYGVPLAMNPFFPINTLMHRPAEFGRYVDAVFAAIWAQPSNMGDPAVMAQTLQRAGLDAAAVAALAGDAEVKARLVANTEEAVARGVFGAPTMFVGEQMFFGQDRLDFVREALG
jgi:2-hydroxychromene-2-carboxylate isomerase